MHAKLPHNLLTLTPIVTQIGAILLDKTEAAIIPDKLYAELIRQVKYFALSKKGLYEVPENKGAICLGAQQTPVVEARSANVPTQHKGGGGPPT